MDGVRGLPDSTSKGRWLLYLLAITAAVLLILLMAAQTKVRFVLQSVVWRCT